MPLTKKLSHILFRSGWSLYGRRVWRSAADLNPALFELVLDTVAARSAVALDVIDVGCGTGAHAIALARRGHRVVGVDYANGMIIRANANRPAELAPQLRFQFADLANRLPFDDNAFDRVLSVSSLQAVPDPTFSLQEIRRVLKPSGRLVLLHAPRPDWYDMPFYAAAKNRMRASLGYGAAHRPLVLAKSLVERLGSVRHWTMYDLANLLETAGFRVQQTILHKPLVLDCTVDK